MSTHTTTHVARPTAVFLIIVGLAIIGLTLLAAATPLPIAVLGPLLVFAGCITLWRIPPHH